MLRHAPAISTASTEPDPTAQIDAQRGAAWMPSGRAHSASKSPHSTARVADGLLLEALSCSRAIGAPLLLPSCRRVGVVSNLDRTEVTSHVPLDLQKQVSGDSSFISAACVPAKLFFRTVRRPATERRLERTPLS